MHAPEAEEGFHQLTEIVPLAWWHMDGRILDANDAYLNLVGYTREDLEAGRLRCADLTPEEYMGRSHYAIEELRSGKPVCTPFEKEYIHRDRHRIPVLVAGSLLPNDKDTGLAFAIDLTVHQWAEDALRQSRALMSALLASLVRDAADSNRGTALASATRRRVEPWSHGSRRSTEREVAAALAHELSQPLGTILANAQSARRLLRLAHPNLRQLGSIVREIISDDRRAAAVIERVRTLAQKGEVPFRRLHVNHLVREVIHLLHKHATTDTAGIELKLAPQALLVRGDRIQLQQVLLNCLFNALEAMAESPKTLLIRTSLDGADSVLIEISDRGPGIPPAHLETIFEPFFSGKSEGLGMGLSICRSIMNAHSGRIWVTNNPEGGATFHLQLPLANAPQRLSHPNP